MTKKKTDFFITYHHSDELAARWIAAVLKEVPFSMLMESWDFLPGQNPKEKIEHMTAFSRSALVLLSDRFLQAGQDAQSWQTITETFDTNAVILFRIDSCDVEKVLGAVTYTNLFGMKEAEARKRLLTAIGTPIADKKETELLPVTAKTVDEVLEKRKAELDELLKTTIKHNYHMKLDLEQEVEKVVEVKNEKTGEIEKQKQLVWETVTLETVLKDGENYILVNPSGMGKTTFLTHAARVLLDRAGDGDYPFVPLFSTCIALNNREGSIPNFIHNRVESFYNNSQTAVVHGEWENLCVLLDALDQARDVDDIVSSLQVHDKYHYYRKAKIILSSRENTAGKVKAGFRKIRLKLPEADEVRYYMGEGNYKKLENHITASGELVTVPVLLEMLKTITEKGYDASKLWNRADLYNEFTRILIDQERCKPRFWQDTLSIRHFIDNELEQVLEKIAFFSLAENKILEIEKEKLAKYCETPEKKEALLNIGIILELFEDREQKVVFRHQSFQSYFAARYIYFRRPELFKKLTGDICFFYHDVWYEVLRFFVGLEEDPKKAGDIIDLIYQPGDNELCQALRLIFTVFLASETRVSIKKVQNLHEQLRALFTNKKQYWYFITSNIDKFNPGNDEQRRSLFIIIEILLRDEEEDFHYVATKTLGEIVTFKDIPLLEPLIRDEKEDIRYAVAEALGKIGASKDIPLLKPLLRDEKDDVRCAAAEALGKIGASKDIPLLVTLLRDEDDCVRSNTAEVLGKFITAKDIPLLEPLIKDDEWYVRLDAAEALGKFGTAKDIPLLEPLLRDDFIYVRHAATEAFGKIATTSDIPLLGPLLKDEEWYVRRAAAKALGKIVTANDIPLLQSLLRDEDKYVRSAAAYALGKICTAKDIPLLEPLIKDEEWYVRCAAAEALSMICTTSDITLLGPLLKDEEWYVRRSAAEALGIIGTASHISLLKPLLRDKDMNVCSAAAGTLGEIGTANDVPLLEPLLRGEDEYVRGAAAHALEKICTAKDIPLLETLLRDQDEFVRHNATEALRKIVTSKDIPLLEALLRDKDRNVRHAAAKALEKIVTANDIDLLETLLRDQDEYVRKVTSFKLKEIVTANHMPLLEPLLKDEGNDVRIFAAEALGKIGTVNDIQLLEPILRVEHASLRGTATEAIEQIYKRSTPILRIDDIIEKGEEKEALFVKTVTTQPLHILHISDIHYAFENDPFITRIFHEFLKDIQKWRTQQNNQKIHSICLTGDIAQSGQKDQYESINEKINAILNTTGCSKDNLFIIPGNHDFQEYDKISLESKTTLEQVRENKINIDSGVLSDFKNYREFHEKFSHYYGFLKTSGYVNSLTEKRSGIPRPWYSRKLKDFHVRIIGLNSALFCLKDYSKRGKIRMGTSQFDEAYFQGKPGKPSNGEQVILLTHHPIDWLEETEKDELKTLIDRYSVIHLHGHVHRLDINEVRSHSGSTYISIGTGSIYGEKGTKDINTYHIMTLDFQDQEIHIWSRRWVPELGMWTVYADNTRNIFSFPGKYS